MVFALGTVGAYLVLDQCYTQTKTVYIVPATQENDGMKENTYASESSAAEKITKVTKTEKPQVLLISATIGGSMAAIALVFRRSSGENGEEDMTGRLLSEGLEDVTVRDITLIKKMKNMEKFTVPELAKKSPITKSSVWRLVKKLAENDLIERTGEKKLPESGRGKPSPIFRYDGFEKQS